jgi:WD40 repeat protein
MKETANKIGFLSSSKQLFASVKGGFVAVEKKSCLAHLVNDRTCRKEPINFADLQFVASDGRTTIILASSNGQVLGWNQQTTRSLCNITSGYLSAVAISKAFGIVATGTEDGFVIVSLSGDGSILWSQDLSQIPRRIVISEAWGFVFVQSDRFLWLFNVNGKLLQKRAFDFEIDQIFSWKCERGFDYIAIAETSGRIRLFEAFFMETDRCVIDNQGKVITMRYNLMTRALVIVTENGDILSIPRKLP